MKEKYIIAEEEKANNLIEQAEAWYSGRESFKSYGKIAIVAVAEYLANQEGLTIILEENQ